MSFAPSSVLYLNLVKMSQTVPSVIRYCCPVSVESPVFWCLSRSVVLSTVDRGLVLLSMLDLRPPPPLLWLPVSVAALAVFTPPSCQSSRPGHALCRRRPRLCLPSSPFWTEIDGVWMSLFPTAPPPLPAPTWASAGILLLRRPVLPPVHRPVFAFHHVVGFGVLVLCVGGNGIIHSAHKAIQGDDCCPRQSSRLRFP